MDSYRQLKRQLWLQISYCKYLNHVGIILKRFNNNFAYGLNRGAADKVVSGQGKLELLVVGAQEIAASTAQLVVASRVKADRKSYNLDQLSQASKGVTNATGGVVATVKDCSQLMDEAGNFNFNSL